MAKVLNVSLISTGLEGIGDLGLKSANVGFESMEEITCLQLFPSVISCCVTSLFLYPYSAIILASVEKF